MGFNNEGCCMLSLWVNPFNHKAIAHVTWWVALSPNDGGLTLTLYMQIDWAKLIYTCQCKKRTRTSWFPAGCILTVFLLNIKARLQSTYSILQLNQHPGETTSPFPQNFPGVGLIKDYLIRRNFTFTFKCIEPIQSQPATWQCYPSASSYVHLRYQFETPTSPRSSYRQYPPISLLRMGVKEKQYNCKFIAHQHSICT